MSEARDGRIVVLQYHGVPDKAHPWVHTKPELFEQEMRHLKSAGFQTMALSDLVPLYDYANLPADPMLRHRTGKPVPAVEVEATQRDLPYWLRNMAEHGYRPEEVERVAGAPQPLPEPNGTGLRLAPYPGGRHTRIGFLEGAIDPLRGTKATVFLPWKNSGYVVIDVPEAIFSNLGLLYLAHTHIPSIWDDQNIAIENRDWKVMADGSLVSEWTLPNKVRFGATVLLSGNDVLMQMWLHNGTNAPLTGLRTQVCVLTKGAPDFAAQIDSNKIYDKPVAGVRAAGRAIFTEWERAGRVWGNPNCPCFHSDPVFPDCAPGQTVHLKGRMWFEGGR